MEFNKHQLIDPYKRHLNYLRISITDRCNLNCIYCNPKLIDQKLPHKEILRYEELLRIVRIGVALGITKVRITGGEPLVRKGCCNFIKQLGRIEGLEDLALTSNGVLLKDYIDQIADSGIKRINISIDTLDRKKYAHITGRDAFDQVWEGIQLAIQKGFYPVKLNVVVLKGINDDELGEFAKMSMDRPVHIRFIEYMPIGTHKTQGVHTLLFPEIKSSIEKIGRLIPVERDQYDGPAMRFRFTDAAGEIGFISPISRHFCATCNRLRLTSDGHLLSCLLSDICEDIKTPIRAGYLDDRLVEVFLNTVKRKPMQRPDEISPLAQPERMVSIGG